jgi:ATP-dependent Clp protease protease subunit
MRASVQGPPDDTGDSWRSGAFDALFQRRSVWLRGPLDEAAATQLAAELLALDAQGDEPIELVINSPGGPVAAGLSVIDVMDLLGAPVTTLCLGQAAGTAAAVLACGTATRRAAPTARITLRLGQTRMEGTASRLRQEADSLLDQRDRLALRLAAATGQLPALVAFDLDEGGFLTSASAVSYGLIDEVASRRSGP